MERQKTKSEKLVTKQPILTKLLPPHEELLSSWGRAMRRGALTIPVFRPWHPLRLLCVGVKDNAASRGTPVLCETSVLRHLRSCSLASVDGLDHLRERLLVVVKVAIAIQLAVEHLLGALVHHLERTAARGRGLAGDGDTGAVGFQHGLDREVARAVASSAAIGDVNLRHWCSRAGERKWGTVRDGETAIQEIMHGVLRK